MINGKVLTCIFLLNRKWPLQQVQDGTAARVALKALETLSPEEYEELEKYEIQGSLLSCLKSL